MLVDAVHMIALREWQGGNQNVDGRVLRSSSTVFMSSKNEKMENLRKMMKKRGNIRKTEET